MRGNFTVHMPLDLFGKINSEMILNMPLHSPDSFIYIGVNGVGYYIDNTIYTIDQIEYMFINKIMEQLKLKDINYPFNLCLSVPSYIDKFKQNLLYSLYNLNGINTIEIIPNYISSSLCYGYENDGQINENEKKIILIDIGYNNSEISLIKYTKVW